MKINQIIKERESTHGDFEMKAIFVQEIMENISGLYSWKDMPADQKESIHMILVKLSRILYGDPDHKDHWMILLDMLYWLQTELKINNDFTDGYVYKWA